MSNFLSPAYRLKPHGLNWDEDADAEPRHKTVNRGIPRETMDFIDLMIGLHVGLARDYPCECACHASEKVLWCEECTLMGCSEDGR